MAHLVSENATRKALLLGFADTEEDAVLFLLEMANQSALVTSKQGNRRYGVLFLTVSDGIVKDIDLDDTGAGWCSTCFGTEVVELPGGSTKACPDCMGTINIA